MKQGNISMKKILSLFLLTITTSLYPYIVQTVVLKNKTSNQRVVLYGDVHLAMHGDTTFSDNEKEQLKNIETRLIAFAQSQATKERLLLLEDMTLSPSNEDGELILKGIKARGQKLALDFRNVDIRYPYSIDAAFLHAINSAKRHNASVSDDQTEEEILAFLQADAHYKEKLGSLKKELGIDTCDILTIRTRMCTTMAKISMVLKKCCQINGHPVLKLLPFIANIDVSIEDYKQGKISFSSLYFPASSPDHLDVKAVYEILTTDKQYIIGFMGMKHVTTVCEMLKDWYDVEYQPAIETEQGPCEDHKQWVKALKQSAPKGVKTEDFDYIR